MKARTNWMRAAVAVAVLTGFGGTWAYLQSVPAAAGTGTSVNPASSASAPSASTSRTSPTPQTTARRSRAS